MKKYDVTLTAHYQKTVPFSRKVKFSGEKNLTLLSYYLKTQDKFLIKREFMKEFGDMTVREIVVLLPSIFAEYEQKLQHTQINLILKQFGGVDISG